MYPSSNVISFSFGKSSSSNFVPGLTYVFPVVFISVTPVDFKNLTSILSLGRSSSFGASGSLGFSVTMCSLTINICFGTSIEEPSANVTISVPSCFPAVPESLAGFCLSVIVAFASSALTAFELVSLAGTTPSFQAKLSPFQTLIV